MYKEMLLYLFRKKNDLMFMLDSKHFKYHRYTICLPLENNSTCL